MKLSILGLSLRALVWRIFRKIHGMRIVTSDKTYNGITRMEIIDGMIYLTRGGFGGDWECEVIPLKDLNMRVTIEEV